MKFFYAALLLCWCLIYDSAGCRKTKECESCIRMMCFWTAEGCVDKPIWKEKKIVPPGGTCHTETTTTTRPISTTTTPTPTTQQPQKDMDETVIALVVVVVVMALIIGAACIFVFARKLSCIRLRFNNGGDNNNLNFNNPLYEDPPQLDHVQAAIELNRVTTGRGRGN